jgi:hypothetical protein
MAHTSSQIVLGVTVVREDIRAGDVVDITMDARSGAVTVRRRVADVRPGPGPYDTVLDLDALTWPCMVCGDERPDAQISVAHRQIPGMEDLFPHGARANVRYCVDRAACAAIATAPGVWPPTGERRPVQVLCSGPDDDRGACGASATLVPAVPLGPLQLDALADWTYASDTGWRCPQHPIGPAAS